MSAFFPCLSCNPKDYLGLGTPEPRHCHGGGDRPAPKGVLGGFQCSCPCRFQPHELHEMANRQHPTDRGAAVIRYRELMREAGYMVAREAQP